MGGKARNRPRWIWISAGVIALAAAGGGAAWWRGRSPLPAPAASPAVYTVQAVTRETNIDVTGHLEPVESEDIGFAGSGKVAGVYVKEGGRVKAGQLVAELDQSAERYDLANLDFKIEKAKISGSKSELALLQLERQMKAAELEEKKVWTTISGIVSSVDIRAGEYVKTGDSISAVVRIIDVSALKAEVEIDELDVPSVSVGQKVRFHIDALPDLEVAGRVSYLPREGRVTDEGIAVLDAEVRIDQPPAQLLPGYAFSAQIQVSEPQTALVLDRKAVRERDGRSFVLLLPAGQDGSPAPREVKTAAWEDGKVRILSGLEAGDRVVSTSGGTAKAGTAKAGGGSAAGQAGGQAAQGTANPLSLFGIRAPGSGARRAPGAPVRVGPEGGP